MITIANTAVLPFDNEGHIFTVGPQNGSKLYMPDTNGWVVEDYIHNGVTGYRPYFKMISPMGTTQVNSSWYYCVWCDGSTIKSQVSGYNDYMGLDRAIYSYPLSDNYNMFLFPRAHNSSAWDTSRWGASKPSITMDRINSGQYRGIAVAGTFSSLQILVTIAVSGTVTSLDNIGAVHFSHYYGNTYYTYSIPRIRKIENNLNDPWKVAVYNTTISMSGTAQHEFYAPIIRLQYTSSAFSTNTYYVDTKFAIT